MAQYYQVVHVTNDDTINNPDVQQQVLLNDQQIVLNDGQQTLFQNNSANNQYQAARIQKIPCSVADNINTQAQQQHSQVIIQQRQQTLEHHQQLAQQQHQQQQQQQEQRPPESLLQESQQNSVQQTQHIYYDSGDTMIPQNALVHHSSLSGPPHAKKQMFTSPHLIQTQPNAQLTAANQGSVPQQHIPLQPQQQIVYRMQTTQQPGPLQQTQMISANTHVIVQQPSGQQVFIPTHQPQDIIIRSPIPTQRIVYPRVFYSTSHQNSVMQSAQHNQIPSPMSQQTNIVQTRLAPDNSQTNMQSAPQHQNVLFHSMHQQLPTTATLPKTNQVQQLPPQNQVTNNTTNQVRFNKLPAKSSPPGLVSTNLYAKPPQPRPDYRPPPSPLAAPVQKAPRPRLTTGVANRNRAPKQRGGNMIVCRSPMIAKNPTSIGSVTVSTATSAPNAVPGQNAIKIQQAQSTEKPTPPKQPVFRTLTQASTEYSPAPQVQVQSHPQPQPQPTQQQQQQQQQQPQPPPPHLLQKAPAAKYRSPPITTNSQQQARLVNNNTNSTMTTTAPDLDLEDSIAAVIVKKEPPKAQPHPLPTTTTQPTNTPTSQPSNTTLSAYSTKEDEDSQIIRTSSGCMTLTEFKKRNAANLPTRPPVANRPPPPSQLNNKTSQVSSSTPALARASNKLPTVNNTTISQSTASSVLQTAHNNYEIQTQHVLQNRSGQQMAEKDRNSAKMLVICVSGDQRLITFTLPRESCTVQDLLEQVGVPFDSNTTIQCVENPGANIDFVVTVGFSMQESPSELISRAEQTLQLSRQQDANAAASAAAAAAAAAVAAANNTANSSSSVPGNSETNSEKTDLSSSNGHTPSSTAPPLIKLPTGNGTLLNSKPVENHAALTTSGSTSTSSSGPVSTTTATNSNQKTANYSTDDIPRKIIEGFLAVCHNCGFSGYDHARCERCKTVFSDPPKKTPLKTVTNNTSGSTSSTTHPNDSSSHVAVKHAPPDLADRKKDIIPKVVRTNNGMGRPKSSNIRIRAARRKAETEVVILTLSSDEDDDEDSNLGSNNPQANNCTDGAGKSNLPEPLPFEPVLAEADEPTTPPDFERGDITDLSNISDPLSIDIQCSSLRIGLLKYCPDKPLTLNSRGLCIEAPLKTDPKTSYRIHIHKFDVAKILGHLSPNSESVLVIYTRRSCGTYIKSIIKSDELDFKSSGATSLGPFDARRLILIFNLPCEKSRNIIRSILSPFEELTRADKQLLLAQLAHYDSKEELAKNKNDDASNVQLNSSDTVQNLLVYPPGKGGLAISINDYLCLATEQYLNDIIIDFYLKWVHNNVIPVHQRDKTFIFSTFFYKRLTTMARGPHEKDAKQTAVQRRHSRVQNWTKNVNLFEKDFIVIPINEQSHWFLAIICFPNLKGPVTFDTNKPVELPQVKKPKNQKVSLQIGNTTITPLSKRETSSSVLAERVGIGDDGSERDEAEGEDSDLLSEDSNFDSAATSALAALPTNSNSSLPMSGSSTSSSSSNSNSNSNSLISAKQEHVAIKQPLILIFDSLTGASRSRVVATLRNYLTCEYKAKLPDAPLYTFNKDNMPGHSVKVPQQNNFTDCGLYVLQYVEQFFLDPIRDYKLPIKQLTSWFDTLAVTRKREEIANLLQTLANENRKTQKLVFPEIPFPTLNGVLIDQPEEYNVEFEEDDMDDEPIDETDTSCGDFDTSIEAEEGNLKDTISKLNNGSASDTQAKKFVFKRRMPLLTAAEAAVAASSIVTTTSTTCTTAGTPARLNNTVKIRKLE